MIFPITLVFMLIFKLLESKPLYKTQFMKDRKVTEIWLPTFSIELWKNFFNIVYIISEETGSVETLLDNSRNCTLTSAIALYLCCEHNTRSREEERGWNLPVNVCFVLCVMQRRLLTIMHWVSNSYMHLRVSNYRNWSFITNASSLYNISNIILHLLFLRNFFSFMVSWRKNDSQNFKIDKKNAPKYSQFDIYKYTT